MKKASPAVLFTLFILLLFLGGCADKSRGAFESARASGDYDGYRRFLDLHPDSSYAPQAKAALRSVEESLKSSKSVARIGKFMKEHPTAAVNADLEKRIGELRGIYAESVGLILDLNTRPCLSARSLRDRGITSGRSVVEADAACEASLGEFISIMKRVHGQILDLAENARKAPTAVEVPFLMTRGEITAGDARMCSFYLTLSVKESKDQETYTLKGSIERGGSGGRKTSWDNLAFDFKTKTADQAQRYEEFWKSLAAPRYID